MFSSMKSSILCGCSILLTLPTAATAAEPAPPQVRYPIRDIGVASSASDSANTALMYVFNKCQSIGGVVNEPMTLDPSRKFTINGKTMYLTSVEIRCALPKAP